MLITMLAFISVMQLQPTAAPRVHTRPLVQGSGTVTIYESAAEMRQLRATVRREVGR